MTSRKFDIIRQPIPTLLATFGALLVLLTIRAVASPNPGEAVEGILSPLGLWFDGLFGATSAIALTTVLTLASSILITRIISRYSISVIRSLVPMVLYIIGICGLMYTPTSPSLHLCWWLILRSSELLIASFKRCEMFDGVMTSAVCLSLGVLLVPDLLWLLWLLPFQWLIYRRSLREMAAAVVAMLSPLIICTFAWWVPSREISCFAEGWRAAFTRPEFIDFNHFYANCGGLIPTILFVLLVLLTLLSIASLATHYQSMRLRARKIHLCFTMLWFSGLTMLSLGYPLAVSVSIMSLGAIPLIHTFIVKHPGLFGALYYFLLVVAAIATALY